jgi:hypothetical protein
MHLLQYFPPSGVGHGGVVFFSQKSHGTWPHEGKKGVDVNRIYNIGFCYAAYNSTDLSTVLCNPLLL